MKTLHYLIDGLIAQVSGPTDIPIEDITFDSRRVRRGSLFVALKGVHVDGHQFISQALTAGAHAVLCEDDVPVPNATRVKVPDALTILAPIASRFFDAPSQKMLTVGITGTNGKTTVAYLVESILKAAHYSPAVLGTINYRFNDQSQPAPNTTPFASELERFLAAALKGGAKSCVLEVSSHALALGRVAHVDFDVAIFTNLTQDHLDFHKTLDAYGEAKSRLFQQINPESHKPYPRRAIINRDDPWSVRMEAACRVPVMEYSLQAPADVTAANLKCDSAGSRFDIVTRRGASIPIQLALLGEYNVMNALAAASFALSQDFNVDAIVNGLQNVKGVPGRMERIDLGQPYTVLVDYAHTEDALRNVLTAIRRLNPNRILTVFGCGGDRDRIKRPLMGEVAARLSDEVFLTSDNPRSEDPQRITLDVEVGLRRVRPDHYQILLDREAAIAQALSQAQIGDVVLIAGKGHENYQILKDRTIPFDDRETARRLIQSASKA